MQYDTGVLIGRAFAFANAQVPGAKRLDPVRELCQLARGDRMALELAQARFREFLAGPTPSAEDVRALALLDAALERFDRLCIA